MTSLRDAPWDFHLGAIPHRAIRKLDPFDSIRRGVVPVLDGDPVVAAGNCQIQMVVVPRGLDVIRRDAGLEAQGVVAGAVGVEDRVLAIAPAEQVDIVAAAAVEQVGSVAADEDVVVGFAPELVVASVAVDPIAPGAAVNGVVFHDDHTAGVVVGLWGKRGLGGGDRGGCEVDAEVARLEVILGFSPTWC